MPSNHLVLCKTPKILQILSWEILWLSSSPIFCFCRSPFDSSIQNKSHLKWFVTCSNKTKLLSSLSSISITHRISSRFTSSTLLEGCLQHHHCHQTSLWLEMWDRRRQRWACGVHLKASFHTDGGDTGTLGLPAASGMDPACDTAFVPRPRLPGSSSWPQAGSPPVPG